MFFDHPTQPNLARFTCADDDLDELVSWSLSICVKVYTLGLVVLFVRLYRIVTMCGVWYV